MLHKPDPYTTLCPGKANKGKPRKARRAVPRKPSLRTLVLRFLDCLENPPHNPSMLRVTGHICDVSEALDALRKAVTR